MNPAKPSTMNWPPKAGSDPVAGATCTARYAATQSAAAGRVALWPWNTPRISSTMGGPARKISGVAAARLSSAKLILLSRLRHVRLLRLHQRGLVRLDQVVDRGPEDGAERARIDAH